jgi:hypothetical protein
MVSGSLQVTEVPVNVVGSSVFGRYPKISSEKTYNMIISDDWLVPYAGYKKVTSAIKGLEGRAIFTSTSYNHMFVVVENYVYQVNSAFIATKIGELETFNGDVYIDENDAHQVAFCDKKNLYIFDYVASTFTKVDLSDSGIPWTPLYISFQDGYFIAPVSGEPQWRLSALNDGTSWPYDSQHVGQLQTKPDLVQACIRLPGKGNHLFVMGNNVTELWVDVGFALFPYQRTSAFNIDYGCINSATIACGDSFVVWLGINEKSGPGILCSDGSQVEQISTDGINFKLAHLAHPEQSSAFLFKQDGHLLYQITFHDKADNFSLVYDFNTKKFFNLSDPNMNYHIARKVTFFNNNYFFVSFNDGNVYKLDTNYTDSDGAITPRIRICKSVRLPDASQFLVQQFSLTLEEGITDTSPDTKVFTGFRLLENEETEDYRLLEDGFKRLLENGTSGLPELDSSANTPRIDLTTSQDGGASFGNSYGIALNKIGYRKNRFTVFNLGYYNDFTLQLRFWGPGRFVIGDGIASIY